MNRWKMAIFSLLGINLLIAALLIGKQLVPIDAAIPSTSTMEPQLQIEFSMEKAGAKNVFVEEEGEKGYWTVEHYREYAYHYDEKGQLIEKRPTAKEEYLRYWHDE